MHCLILTLSAAALLAAAGCQTQDPASPILGADPAAKRIVSSSRAGGHGSGRVLRLWPHQGTFYAPYYGTDPTNPFVFSRLGSVDIHTGAVTQVVPELAPYHQLPNLIASAAFDVDGTLYTIINRIGRDNPSSQLAIIDLETGEVTPVGSPDVISKLGLEIDGRGRIFATGYDSPGLLGNEQLYQIHKDTGAATPIGDTGIYQIMDLAFDTQGTLYAVASNVLYTLDLEDGHITSQIPLEGVPMQRLLGGLGCGTDENGAPVECQRQSEVMSLSFDKDDVLYGLSMVGVTYPLLEVDGVPQGAPLLRIDPATGVTEVVAWTGEPNFHSGDIPPAKVAVCHSGAQIEVGLSALDAHLAHGDVLPGPDGSCE